MNRNEFAWDESRWQELEQLESLLRLGRRLNQSSGAINNAYEIIRLSEVLSEMNLAEARVSFVGFLRGLAIAAKEPSDA